MNELRCPQCGAPVDAGVIMIGDLSDMVKITEALEKHALYKDVLG